MKALLHTLLAASLMFSCAAARAAEEEEENVAEEQTNAPPAAAQEQEAEPTTPALTALVLGAGTAAFILSGVDWGDSDTNSQPAAAPAQSRPAEGETLTDSTITFTWKAHKDAASYLIEINGCESPDVCASLRLDQTPETSFTIAWPPEYPAGRWRIRAVDASNIAGPWSPFRSFTVSSPSD